MLIIILIIRVLCIGNSFSWDAVEQELVPLCANKGIEIEIYNLYYPGCSLEQHVEFLEKDTAAYSLRVCKNYHAAPIRHPQSRTIRKEPVTLRQALNNGTYDFISLQQASHDSGLRETYEPWLSALIDTVRAYQPDAQLCWMQTWAYSQDAKHPAYPRYHCNQQEMWDSIQACTRYVQTISNDLKQCQTILIPCGSAIQLARQTKLGDSLCRDGYHLNYVYGRYTASCVWYEIITGKDVRRNKYKNPEMTKKQRRLTQKSAHQAVKNAKNALF